MESGEGNGSPLQYSCLENPMGRGAWWAADHGVAQSRTQLKWLSMHACMHWRRKWQPTSVFLPGESQGWRSLVGCVYRDTQSQTRLKWLSSNNTLNTVMLVPKYQRDIKTWNFPTLFMMRISKYSMEASLIAQLVKNPSAMQETWVQSLGLKTHSSILAWRIPGTILNWTEYSLWGHKESDTTERLSLSQASIGLPW